MARGKYKMTPEELAYGEALQRACENLQEAVTKGASVPQVCEPDAYGHTELMGLVNLFSKVTEMKNNMFTLGKRK